jgi:hypothetical protein
MPTTDGGAWNALESWSSTAFLLAGVLLLLFVVLSAVAAFTTVLGEGALVGAAVVGSGLSGLLLAVVGLLGLYPQLSASAPRVSRVGLGALTLAVTGIVVVIGSIAIVGPPEAPGDVPSFVPPIFIASGILLMLGYVLFAVASIRTHTPSRRIGFLLAVPALVLLWHYLALAAFGSQHVFEIIDYTIISTAFLSIGYLLRTGSVSVTSTEPTPDSTS